MATYKQVQDLVRERHSFVPKTCWIAHVLFDNGVKMRTAVNRITSDMRRHPCPDKRRGLIEEALRHFGMIGQKSN